MVKNYRNVKEYMAYQNYMDFVKGDSQWLIANPDENAEKLAYSTVEAGKFIVDHCSGPIRCGRSDYMLLFSHQGEGLLHYEEELYPLPAGALVMVDCTKPYVLTYSKNSRSDWEFFWIRFQGQACSLIYEEHLSSEIHVCVAQNPDSILREFKRILSIFHQPGTETILRLSHAISFILTSLIEQSPGSVKCVRHQDTIAQAVSYIHENYNGPLDIDQLAAKAGLSKYYFIKLFKEFMHVAPYEYVIVYRINEAKKFLRTTSLKVSQISEAVGFNDECNFIRTFKRITGQTPLQYRDKQR